MVKPRFKRQLPKNYIRQWRKRPGYGLSLVRLGERVGMSHASLSRIECGLQPWNQSLLLALSEALGTDWVSLLTRDPSDPEGLWSIWDQAKPGQRQQIVEIAKTLLKTG